MENVGKEAKEKQIVHRLQVAQQGWGEWSFEIKTETGRVSPRWKGTALNLHSPSASCEQMFTWAPAGKNASVAFTAIWIFEAAGKKKPKLRLFAEHKGREPSVPQHLRPSSRCSAIEPWTREKTFGGGGNKKKDRERVLQASFLTAFLPGQWMCNSPTLQPK